MEIINIVYVDAGNKTRYKLEDLSAEGLIYLKYHLEGEISKIYKLIDKKDEVNNFIKLIPKKR